ncbi:MAG: type II toxin-antitoxin system RelE/ParE family toxin [Ignavibacteria bacterium]|nr:type II toxin-antitoxin system RelE/ParE family toxin [Ignavibacteria bacterium]
MAKKIIWSVRSQKDIIDILGYWNSQTGNKKYSYKLYNEFLRASERISNFNNIGKTTDILNTRYIIRKNYKIFYRLNKNHIEILTVFDNRRNPNDLKLN